MHHALSPGSEFHPDHFRAQTAVIADLIRDTGATRVLELGCGLGFNMFELAAQSPETQIVGLDLLARHIRKINARAGGNPRISAVQASYDQIPEDIGMFDIIFAVETLCHASDRIAVAASIRTVLKPGGLLVVFDAARSSGFDDLSDDLQMAVKLYEAATAVHSGFGTKEQWSAAYAKAGLTTVRLDDLSPATVPGLRRTYRYGKRYFSDPVIRTATSFFPWALKANAVGALMGPYLIEGTFEDKTPDPVPGIHYCLRICTR